jgi:hypothetical protein
LEWQTHGQISKTARHFPLAIIQQYDKFFVQKSSLASFGPLDQNKLKVHVTKKPEGKCLSVLNRGSNEVISSSVESIIIIYSTMLCTVRKYNIKRVRSNVLILKYVPNTGTQKTDHPKFATSETPKRSNS